MFSDREILLALFSAIGALAKRLTGDTLVVKVKDVDGLPVKFYASPTAASWCGESSNTLANLGAVEPRRVDRRVSAHTPVASQSEENATAREVAQSAGQSANR